MSEKGILIDIGFKADINDFVDNIKQDFKKIDFDDIVGLSEAFKKQEEDIRKQLKDLSKVIDETINGKIPNDPSKQLQSLNKAVTVLSNSMKDMIKSMPSDQAKKFSSNVEDITKSVNGLAGVCSNATKVVEDLENTTSGGIQFVDADQKRKLQEVFYLLERGNQSLEKFYSTRNKHGQQPYEDSDDALTDVIAQNKVYEECLKEIQSIEEDTALSEVDRVDKLDKAYATFSKIISDLSRTVNTFVELSDSVEEGLAEMIPSDMSKDGEKSLGKLQGQLEGWMTQTLEYIAKRKAEIQKEFYDFGGGNLQSMFDKGIRKRDTISIPVSLKTSAKTLLSQTKELIYNIQEKLNANPEPIEIEVMLVSSYKSKQNQKILNNLKNSLGKIEDKNIRAKTEKIIDSMTEQIKNALAFDVRVKTEKATQAVKNFVTDAKNELALLSSDLAPLEPEIILTDEHRESFKSQLKEMKDDFKITIDGLDEDGEKKEIQFFTILKSCINEVTESIENKSLAFIDEGEIVKSVVGSESEYLNHLYGDLISIEEQVREISEAFKLIPNNISVDFDIKSINNAYSDALDKIQNAKNAIEKVNKQISSNFGLSLDLPEDQVNNLIGDINNLKTQIDNIFTTSEMESWKNEFINSLTEVSNKIANLFGNNALNDMIKDWQFSDELMKKAKGDDHLRERAALIASDGNIYGSGTYDQHTSTNIGEYIQEEIKKMGLSQKIGVHSHGSDRIAASSIPQGQNSVSGDLASFYYDYLNYQVEKQLTIALNDIEVFDAQGFYESNKNINFNNRSITDKIRDKKEEYCSQISDHLNSYFVNFVNEYGSGDFSELKNNILNDKRFLKGQRLNYNYKKVAEFIDNNVSSQQMLDTFFNEMNSNTNNDDISLVLANSFRKSIGLSLKDQIDSGKKISEIFTDQTGIDMTSEEFKNILRTMQENILRYAEDITNSTFNIGDFDYGIAMNNPYDNKFINKSDRDLFTYAFRKTTPQILEEALAGTGYKNNYQDYMKSYTTDEFIKQNPLGLQSSTLSDMFNNAAPKGFLETLDKIVEDLTQIKSAASSNDLKDMFNIKFDEASLKEMTSLIDGLISKLDELFISLNGNGDVKSQLKSRLKEFVNEEQYLGKIENSDNFSNDYEMWDKASSKHNEKFNSDFWAVLPDEMFGEDGRIKAENDWEQSVEKIIEKSKELGISLESLGVKESEVTNPLQKLGKNFEQFSSGVSIFNETIDKLIDSLKILSELMSQDNTKLNTNKIDDSKIDTKTESFTKEGQTVDYVVDNEINKLKKLEEQLDKVTNAVNNKTEAFKKEGEVVNNVADGEIASLNPLQNLESSYNNFKPFYDNGDLESEAGANAALAYYNSYKEALESKLNKKDIKQYTIGNMDDLFTGNYADYKKGTGDLDLSGLISQIDKYKEVIDKLNQPEVINIINALSESIKQLLESGNTSEKTTEFLEQLNKVINNLSNNKSAEKIQKISDNLLNFQKSLNILNSTDQNGFVKSLSSILEKGSELKALGEVLKATEKQIQAAGNAVKGQDNYDIASKYLSSHETDINNSIKQVHGSNGNEILYTKLSATKEGLVQVISLIKDANNNYQKYTDSVDLNGKVQARAVENNQEKLAAEARTLEKLKKLRESIIPGAANLGVEGETFTPDSNGWSDLVSKAAEFGIEVKDIEKIIRNVDEIGQESFQIFTKLSRITVGMNSKGVLFQYDNVLDTSVVDDFVKKTRSLSLLLKGAFNGDATGANAFYSTIKDVQEEWEQIINLGKKGLISKEVIDETDGFLQSLKTTIANFSIDKIDLSNKTPQYIEDYKIASEYLEKLYASIEKVKTGQPFTDDDIELVSQFSSKIRDLFSTINDKDNNFSKDTSINKQLFKIYDVMDKNSSMSKELKEQFKQLAQEMNSFGGNIPADKLQEFNERFMKLSVEMKETGQVGKSFFDMIKSRISGMSASYIAMYFSLYDVIRYVKELISYVTELDTAMVELKKVTDGTEEQYKNFKNTISQTAKEVASTNSELISSAADWARLGYSIEQSAELAKNSAMFVNVGDGIDINTATEDMISAMKAFNIEAEDSMRIVDAYNEVGNNFAISASGIGEAMQRSSSALSAANNSFEQSIALVTAMNEILQDTETTGTTLKVLSLRLRGASTEIEDMGESTDGMAESASKLRDKIAALTNTDGTGGINILTESGDFKSTYEMIQGIASKWKDISDVNQAALLELIAGKTRANGVAALLNNWEKLDEVVSSATNSEGSALKENEAVINSIEGKIKILKSSIEELANDLISSSLVKGIVDIGTNAINLLDKFIKKSNTLVKILATIGTTIGVINIKNGGGRAKTHLLVQ